MTIGHAALMIWPLISLFFFKRFSIPLAVLLTIMVGYLVLPEKIGVNLPALPSLNKRTVPAITALVLAMIFASKNTSSMTVLPGIIPRSMMVRFLCVLLVVGAFLTVVTNSDALQYGPRRLPGLSIYDAFSDVLSSIMFLLPIFLARKYLASPEAHRLLLHCMVIAGLVYSFLMLVELRMSPLIHYWTYGFFPHSWAQHVRGGGWRPVVFLGHGSILGIFISATILAALGLARSGVPRKKLYWGAAIWLFLVLAVSKNLGALLITTILIGTFIVLSRRLHLLVVVAIAAMFITYPALRGGNLLPTAQFVAAIETINPLRAASFQTRLDNEDNFLSKISERPLFGWGGWGRARTYNSETGVDTTLADGAWIITLAVSGWAGYIAKFGLICGPIFALFLYRRRYTLSFETSALLLVLGGNIVNMIANGSLTPVTGLVLGALWGYAELAKSERAADAAILTDAQPNQEQLASRETPHESVEPSTIYTRQTRRIIRQ